MVHPFCSADVALPLLPLIPIFPLFRSVVSCPPLLICHELVFQCQLFLVFQALEEGFLPHCHQHRLFSCVVKFQLEDVGVLDHGLLVGGGHLVGGDVGGRFG